MALKDWKLIENNSNEFEFRNIKTNKKIIGEKERDQFNRGWIWIINNGVEDFKSKSQAISFARNYMRSH